MGACFASIYDVAIGLGLVWLLPRSAPDEQH